MNRKIDKWIEAGKLFALDNKAKVTCPECGKSTLKSIDIVIPGNEAFERKLFCVSCGAENYLRLHRKID